MPEFSIISASCDSPEWAELFVKSVRMFTDGLYEIIIVDNGSKSFNLAWIKAQNDILLIHNDGNLGHGMAMDQGLRASSGRYVIFLDIDSHVQRSSWTTDLRDIYHKDEMTRLIGCIGPEHKPLHPPLFFFEKRFIIQNNLAFAYMPNIDPRSTDTAQLVYWKILELGYKVERLPKGERIYPDFVGDEIWVNGKPTIAHMWYGTRFRENTFSPVDKLDGYSREDYLKNKKILFSQKLVQRIMGEK